MLCKMQDKLKPYILYNNMHNVTSTALVQNGVVYFVIEG